MTKDIQPSQINREKLENASGTYHNIDIDSLKNKVEKIRESDKISTFAI